MNHATMIFDGVCNLCNSAVQFVIRRDPAGYFRLAASQSIAGKRILSEHQLDAEGAESVVLIENGVAFTRSTAALRIARRLRFPWPLFAGFLLIPKCLRDPLYNWIARHRYGWFGKRDACVLPDDQSAQRFLS